MLLQSLPIRCNQAFGIYGLVIISAQVANAEKEKVTYILFLASSKDKPWRVNKDRSCVATPMPEEPAPKNRMRCSVNGKPEAAEAKRAAFINPESTTAPGRIYHKPSQWIDDSRTCALNLGIASIPISIWRRSTHVIVEASVLLPKHIQVSESIVCGEIFKLDKQPGGYFRHSLHELSHEFIHLWR